MIKVSDFGLTEDVYARNYFRQGREDGVVKLPVKWMSPESLNDGVFTEKTDVVCTYLEVERCTMFSLISLVSGRARTLHVGGPQTVLQWKQMLGWSGSVGMFPKENLDSLRSLLVTQSRSQQSTCAIFHVYMSSVLYCVLCFHRVIQWSFGVTCWEIFSGGKTPYPGVDPLSLVQLLENGQRLDKPLNAACPHTM